MNRRPYPDQDRTGAAGPLSGEPSVGNDRGASVSAPHIPVLLQEVLAALSPRDGETFVDGTFGAGGYSRALLDSCDCRVFGIDRDPQALAAGEALRAQYGARLTLLSGRFGDMDALLNNAGVTAVDGVTLDLGVSSMQLDQAERGFSFRADGPLDMRMEGVGEEGQESGPTAADLVNGSDEQTLADIIFTYGEERFSRAIARAIVAARAEAPITRTGQLADIVRTAVRRRIGRKAEDTIDPATRTFQALRIAVNDELGEVDRGLAAAERLLRPGGRLAVVAFHSLEDRRVKTFLSVRSGASARPSRHSPSLLPRETKDGAVPSFRLTARKAAKPSAEEAARNPRARSARLRAAIRTEVPVPAHDGSTEARL